MEIEGRIKMIDETKAFGANGFRKREMVVTTQEQYPQHIMIEFTQDKCDLLDTHNVGDNVTVGINLRGKEWVNPQGETKYFNSITGWRIEKTQAGARDNSAADDYHKQHPATPQDAFDMPNNSDDGDGLPF
jgi:hypothetical protein